MLDNEIDLQKQPAFITMNWLKKLHRTIAQDLLPINAGLPAGKFRNYNNITVGEKGPVFPSAESLNKAASRRSV